MDKPIKLVNGAVIELANALYAYEQEMYPKIKGYGLERAIELSIEHRKIMGALWRFLQNLNEFDRDMDL